MNIHESGNTIVYSCDITTLLHIVGQTVKVMQCLLYMERNPFTVCGMSERRKKGRQTERKGAIYY